MRRGLLAALAMLALTGCAEKQRKPAYFGSVRVSGQFRSTWTQTSRPASTGPAANPAGLIFLDARHGFAVFSAAGCSNCGRGYGQIQETLDGGATWRTVWRRSGVFFDSIAFADPMHGFAIGQGLGRGASAEFLVRTADGGRSWRALHTRIPSSFHPLLIQFPTPQVGYASADPDVYAFSLRWVVKTTDGGRSWHVLPRPRGVVAAGVADFVDARLGFVPGYSRSCSGLWRTRDGGRTWSVLPQTCRSALTAVDFVTPRLGFSAGGNPYYYEKPPWQIVRRTRDGGRTWRTIFVDLRRRNPGTHPIVKLSFVDPGHGFGATGGCKNGQNSPCGGELLLTGNGGRTWRSAGMRVLAFSAVDPTHAWAVPDCMEQCGVLWRTGDGGRTWRPLASRGGPTILYVAVRGRRLVVDSSAGYFGSDDGGASWRALHPRPPLFAPELVTVQAGLVVASDYGRTLALSNDEGRTWRRVRSPLASPEGVAFADARRGFVFDFPYSGTVGGRLYSTRDGGRTWRRVATPFQVNGLSASGTMIAIVAHDPRRVAWSVDGGRRWRTFRLPREAICNLPAQPGPVLWLGCYVGMRTVRHSAVFRSTDAGRTFNRLVPLVPAPWIPLGILGASAKEAWATSETGGGWLWHTRDGGKGWVREWPDLPTPG